MIRRAAALLACASVAALLALATGAGEDGEPTRYWIELDNAFGLVEGGDVRIAGVRAGQVRRMDLDIDTKKALVEIELTSEGFDRLRSDAFCESRPQSPIGEYYVDCLPGRARRELRPGSRLPVRQTASTIAPDLIQNVMRRPYRERLRLVLNEFGAGLAGRGDHLNAAIRRAVPALRQSDRVLGILADHRRVIRSLVGDADVVLKALADNRRDVGRFVVEARDTASASAERREDIATNFRTLPRFLEELTPTMAALGETADAQRPVLVDLRSSAGELRRFFDDTAEFSGAARPSVRALGRAAVVGREAASAARPQVAELRRYAGKVPDLARNLRFVLEDFDDRDRAVERDPRSPGGRGYTGLEALLRYVFNQSMATNAFDQYGHMLRIALHTSPCAPYADASTAKESELQRRCRSWLGPNQPGVTTPDPTAGKAGDAESANAGARRERAATEKRDAAAGAPSPSRPTAGTPTQRELERLLQTLPKAPAPRTPEPETLLDYLLAP